jgi:hypothetical protein
LSCTTLKKTAIKYRNQKTNNSMAKSNDARKNVKKEATKTPKEKKAAKQVKKSRKE